MSIEILTVPGPPVSKVSKEIAEDRLQKHPGFPKGASYSMTEIEGHWVASIAFEKEAAPPAFLEDGDAGETDDAPTPPEDKAPEGPPSDDAPSEDGPPSDDDKPRGDDKKGEGKKSLEAQVEHLTTLLTSIADALGIAPVDSGIPGEEGPEGIGPEGIGPEGPPHGGPEGLDGPPPPGPHGGPKGPIPHPLKPGDTPPGGTPVGAPAFASVREDHPWANHVGKVATFTVEERDTRPTHEVYAELKELADEVGYKVSKVKPGQDSKGNRTVAALVSAR